SVIAGYQELLLEQIAGPLTAKQLDYLERAQRSTRELNALIIATLDLSRFSAKRVKIDWQDVPVEALLDELSREVTSSADNPNVHLGWQCSTDAGILHSDPLKLK